MFDIYLAPGRAFARLKEKPSWLIPLIVALLFNMLVAFVSAHYVDWDKPRQVAIDRMRERNMSEEQIDRANEGMEKFYSNPVTRYGMMPLTELVKGVVYVLFLAVVCNVSLPLLGGVSDFKRTWAIVCNASLVAVPCAIVRGALVLLKRSAEVTTSLLMAAPGLKPGFRYVLLARADINPIWGLILVAVGLNVVFGLKGSKSYVLVFVFWAVLTFALALLGARAGG